MSGFQFSDAIVHVSRPPAPTEQDRLVLGAVLEGCCPNGHGALEPRDSDGWCSTCQVGWAATWDGHEGEIRMTFEPPDVSLR